MLLPMCEVPIEHNWGGSNAEFRGNMYMMHVVGKVMEKSNGSIAGLVFDAHGTHDYLKKVLHGQVDGLRWRRSHRFPFSDLCLTRNFPCLEIHQLIHGWNVRELGVCFSCQSIWDDL